MRSVKVKKAGIICVSLFVLFLAASLVGILPFSIGKVRAQGGDIEAGIFPSQGTSTTDIVIRFYTRNASIGNVDKADLFWDEALIGLNIEGNLSANGSYNYMLRVPSQPPLSDIGNHTVTASSLVFNYGQVSFNFTFTITEFVPNPEYIALNATYYSILANYTDLLNLYTELSFNYSTLLADYDTLFREHGDLLSNYNSLSANYNSLVADYNALSASLNSLLTNYNALNSLYSHFLTNYTKLVETQNSLSSNYNSLSQNYTSLESSYHDLKTSYDSTVSEQATTRSLSYIFIASTVIFAATTVYLISRPKVPSRARKLTFSYPSQIHSNLLEFRYIFHFAL